MTRTPLLLALVTLSLTATLAFAEPEFILRYPDGVPQVSIAGDYPGARYVIARRPAAGGTLETITDGSILCLGSCYAVDRGAVPGESYHYFFELFLPGDGGAAPVRYGPYEATISPALARPVGVFVYPNPGRGPTGIQVHLAGAAGDPALTGEVAIYDPAGRRVRTVRRGAMARGLSTLTWDGRDDRGAELRAGVYLVRVSAATGSAVARILRR